jgi:hypothetical protein
MRTYEPNDYVTVLVWNDEEPENFHGNIVARTGDDTYTVQVWNGYAQELTATANNIRPRTVYVNAYSVGRAYGGAEEGGWYYDYGTPLASIPVTTEAQTNEARALLRARLGPDYEGARSRYSVIGDDNLEIYTEDNFAAPFPAQRPHYE